MKRNFIQIGIASQIECAKLLEDGGHLSFDLPGICDGEWHGLVVDVHPASLIYLAEQVVNTPLFKERLKVINAAVVDTERFVTVRASTIGAPDLSCALSDADLRNDWARPYEFSTYGISLDALFDEVEGDIDLLYMNIEGIEGLVLASCTWAKKPNIIATQIHTEQNAEKTCKSLRDAGYIFVKESNDFFQREKVRHPMVYFQE